MTFTCLPIDTPVRRRAAVECAKRHPDHPNAKHVLQVCDVEKRITYRYDMSTGMQITVDDTVDLKAASAFAFEYLDEPGAWEILEVVSEVASARYQRDVPRKPRLSSRELFGDLPQFVSSWTFPSNLLAVEKQILDKSRSGPLQTPR